MSESREEKVSVYREAVAGVTTFFTMAYIVVVNPSILHAEGKTGVAFLRAGTRLGGTARAGAWQV